MKTTEQAAIECANEMCAIDGDKIIIPTKDVNMAINHAFKAGKAFAEEFIDFKDEMPPFSKDKILLKREKPNSEIIYELRRFTTGNKAHILAIYTHWRPINKK